eukprot:TRINITY_DN1636_c0_g1_i1.p2 TRINITY_DN1636_c0_g1~~TRINITY_DN1636_c0_g1_i1.p2  ORF type:complete len:120 (+),score=1.08 TRINITY_DN1636_c0_g1_i1:399-758(+)
MLVCRWALYSQTLNKTRSQGPFYWQPLLVLAQAFLAFAIAAEKFKLEKPQFKYKSFYYLNGLTEGTETIAVFIAFCIWPQHFYTFSQRVCLSVCGNYHHPYLRWLFNSQTTRRERVIHE